MNVGKSIWQPKVSHFSYQTQCTAICKKWRFTKRPLEQLVRQSVEGNLPPSVENAPQELQDELLGMQSLSSAQLMRIAVSQVEPAQQERHLLLLEQNSAGNISNPGRRRQFGGPAVGG